MDRKQLLYATCTLALTLFLTGFTVTAQAAEKKAKTPPAQQKNTSSIKDNITGMEFIKVPGGCYQRGDQFGDPNAGKDESPAHEVCVDSFNIGKYEVTQAEWRKVMGTVPTSEFAGDTHPVQMVSWEDVQKFIFALNQKSGKNYRLPTEAEWEYAARSGGKKEKWSGTSAEKEIGKYAWHGENSQSTLHPVGQKQPNALGVYDMTGNVWEWVADWFGAQTYVTDATQPKKQNPRGPDTGTDHIIRGGAFNSDINGSRTSVRPSEDPKYANTDLGFRLVLPLTK